ncbi:FmdB family transcriptional regulator [Kitasatospora sp. NBC_00240]|uniref:FmdB family zinc ribbon protein n=1 Tax=Kitasatospora sp. NBC_00240 TaxID=2903567 RepID=UPI00225B1954|nr:FmdB family zinc ribbon protein [Kitasatospora sp. NBC_00240]MCX5211168.1 FmdB family transcriptional regulator [Kitasatospora sp. NBC_00240]
MPTYQYQCTECGNGLEAVQKFTDDALTTCPDCQGRLRKVFSAVGVVFKGSGFYRTDSRSSSSSSVGGASSAATAGSGSSTGGSSTSGSSTGGSSTSTTPAPAAAKSTGSASAS